MPKYIFVIGGVMSSVGKGVVAASISRILQEKGYKTTNVKCDMYVNIDAGTIRPTEHGEVFVGEDGIESDQDLGNYERFTGNNSSRINYITTGQIYQEVIRKERNLEYDGEDVEVVPDIPNEIIRRLKLATEKDNAEINVVEFGGTVGEYQLLLFLEAARIMKFYNPDDVAFILVSYLPLPKHVGEMKTKPTQYAVTSLNSAGIQADFIIARGEKALDQRRRDILAKVCNLRDETVIAAPDVESIYEVPLVFEEQRLGEKVLERLKLEPKKEGMKEWKEMVEGIKKAKGEVKIALVGKYFTTGNFTLIDSYISVIEAIKHACWFYKRKPTLAWIDSESYEKDSSKVEELKNYDCVVVPGGFGKRGTEGIITAIKYVRENNIPFLGLCYGMQLAVIEFARNVCGLDNANSVEINKETKYPVINFLEEQEKIVGENNYGATMRLGAYPANLKENTLVWELYGKKDLIEERHRHRYEVEPRFINQLEEKGLVFSGVSPDRKLMEFMELPKNKFYVGTQAHPCFNSRPFKPAPLFLGLIKAFLDG